MKGMLPRLCWEQLYPRWEQLYPRGDPVYGSQKCRDGGSLDVNPDTSARP